MLKHGVVCRTALEAEAYAAHISGLHLIEHPGRKAQALAKLLTAQCAPIPASHMEIPS